LPADRRKSSPFPILAAALAAIILCLALVFLTAGCLGGPAEDISWATPAGNATAGSGDGIQETLDTYAQALVDKDREAFAGVLDPGNPEFTAAELERFDRLMDVPFDRYYLELLSQRETAPGTVAAKVAGAYTLRDSFADLPDLQREAWYLVNRDGAWKLSGDAGEQVLGRKREPGFEDFGKVGVLSGERAIVFYHLDAGPGTAQRVLEQTQAAMPRLEEVMSGTSLPRVPVKVYADKAEIDLTFPGKWQEWTGGAARQLGEKSSQGGEIIIDAQVFEETDRADPNFNQKMLGHELTHIALFPLTGNRTPPFLIEGLADYVGGAEDVMLLRDRLRQGGSFSPGLRDLYRPGGFSTLLTTEAATLAYEEADTAVALLEERYGNDKVMELLREFRRREQDKLDQDSLVDEVFRTVLGTGWSEFEDQWRQYVAGG